VRNTIWLLLLAGCTASATVDHPAMVPVAGPERIISGTGLRYIDVHEGEGVVAERALCVYTHYTLYRRNGQWLESSTDVVNGKPGEPLSFILGAGKVIKGWDLGIEGMKVGGTRRLFVPDDMGYGAAGSPPLVPPHAFLVFDIHLMAVTERRNGACVSWEQLRRESNGGDE
jgi:FKBP-type peptidyl-prolyl cis-trans isomerase